MPEAQDKIKKLVTFLKQNPDDSFTKFALALELIKQNEVSKARVLFESVLKQDPGYLGVYYHLGKLYEQIGLQADARILYTDGIELAATRGDKRTELELKDALETLNIELDYED
jgi:Tfp pilus assembly protein PilF